MFYRHFHVRETSPGTHTFFPTYTCPVYCWRSVQLLDFSLLGNLIHASQPIRTTFTGQWFASGFLQTPPHDNALAIGCTLPTAGRVRDFHPLERAPAGRTRKGEEMSLFALLTVMQKKGLEPSRYCYHTDLNRARLPIPPLRRGGLQSLAFECSIRIPQPKPLVNPYF